MKPAALDYPTMTLWEIAALPVRRWAADNAHLYLWTTQSFLRDAYMVLEAWGGSRARCLVWSKPPKGVCGTYVCSTELCIFARRGSLEHKKRQLGTCYEWPRSHHSAKPEAFIDMVESISPGPYLEMFARRMRLGWSTWGNQCFEHVSLRTGAVAPSQPLKTNYPRRRLAKKQITVAALRTSRGSLSRSTGWLGEAASSRVLDRKRAIDSTPKHGGKRSGFP